MSTTNIFHEQGQNEDIFRAYKFCHQKNFPQRLLMGVLQEQQNNFTINIQDEMASTESGNYMGKFKLIMAIKNKS